MFSRTNKTTKKEFTKCYAWETAQNPRKNDFKIKDSNKQLETQIKYTNCKNI